MITDLYSYNIEQPILFRISRRIELATKMNITSRWGASDYQITNYGLAGMVNCHHDSYGYESGKSLNFKYRKLSSSGDFFATVMGWLNDVQAGGSTAFLFDDYESEMKPAKGSAAFWINLDAAHWNDPRTTHGGCPVLKGSKWIITRMIFSFDQWKTYPCSIRKYDHILPF